MGKPINSFLTYFSWENLSGHSNWMAESRILLPGHKILDSAICFVAYAVAHIQSCSHVYMFSIVLSDSLTLYGISVLSQDSTYATLQYPYILDTHLTFWPIFLGKACLDTEIGWLNPELYDTGRKNVDSTVQFATWSGLFCRIRKSHTQLHIWNHARTLTYFPFLLHYDSHNTYRILA